MKKNKKKMKKRDNMKKNKRYLNRDKNGFSAILETLIAVGISVTLLTIFFYSTATLYTVQDKPEADVAARAVGVMETLIGSTGQDNSSYQSWEDTIFGPSGPEIPKALGLGTSPTVEYGIVSYNTTTKKTNVTCRYGASSDIGLSEACFLAGTKIVMADSSYKNIEDIKIGDIVKSYDTETKMLSNCMVSQVYHHTPEEMPDYYMIINNQLRVTPNHRFYSDGRWVEAGKLETGDSLFYQCSDYKIYSIERVFEKTYTYNFEVKGYHNYFVALEDNDMLVHNAGGPTQPVARAGGPYYGEPGTAIEFDGSSSTGYTSLSWEFGDDTTGSGEVVQKTYPAGVERDYKVNLTATKGGNSHTDRTIAYISYVPHAEFEGFDKDGLCGSAVVYLNAEKSSGNIDTYHWTAENQNGDKVMDENDTDPYITYNFVATGVYYVTLNTSNSTHYDTFTDTIYVNQLGIPEPTPEPWVLSSKNIYPEDEDASFLSYGSNYYVKYTNLTGPPLIYKRFEVKQKTSSSTPILDIDKVIALGEFNYFQVEQYDAIRETLGLLTDQVNYNFNITITYTNLSGGTINKYFGPSYQNIVGGVREEVTRQVYIYNPPEAHPPASIVRPPYYLIGEITVHIFLGGQFGI
jgi:hypothetical protein